MIDKNSIIKVVDLILPNDFYDPKHAKIYEIITELFEKNEPIDILSVSNKLKGKNELIGIGGSTYISELINSVPSAAHIAHYAKLIHDKKILRDLITAAAEIN